MMQLEFAKAILSRPEEHEIVRINYFTARIKYDPSRRTTRQIWNLLFL